MTIEQEERDRLRNALVAFYEGARKAGKIRSVRAWVTASGVGYNTLNDLIKGKKNKRLEEESYFRLAAGASKLLDRHVSVAELQGLLTDFESGISDEEQALLSDLEVIGMVDASERRDIEELIRKRAQAARARQQPSS